MVVPNCHVKRLVTARMPGGLNVIGIETDQGHVPVQPAAPVIIALGTIESARLALLSLQGEPNSHLVGRNLMAHLRSNLTIRLPREALATLDPNVKALQASALFVKGRHRHGDGTTGHFHLQITASGLGALGTDSEADLFKKVPDIDGFAAFQAATANHVVITIRGIGEMESLNPNNFVRLDAELDEFGVPGLLCHLLQPRKTSRCGRQWIKPRRKWPIYSPASGRMRFWQRAARAWAPRTMKPVRCGWATAGREIRSPNPTGRSTSVPTPTSQAPQCSQRLGHRIRCSPASLWGAGWRTGWYLARRLSSPAMASRRCSMALPPKTGACPRSRISPGRTTPGGSSSWTARWNPSQARTSGYIGAPHPHRRTSSSSWSGAAGRMGTTPACFSAFRIPKNRVTTIPRMSR